MRAGTAAVRDALRPDVPDVLDVEIHEALWFYYYDIGETVSYLLNTRTKKGNKEAPSAAGVGKKKKKKEKGRLDFPFYKEDAWEIEKDGLGGGFLVSWFRGH